MDKKFKPHTFIQLPPFAGRRGLGNIFMWAAGNGGINDSCACDGYASSIYTLSVSSVTEQNRRPYYLEECASTFAATYSSGNKRDRRVASCNLLGTCTAAFTGTSARHVFSFLFQQIQQLASLSKCRSNQ